MNRRRFLAVGAAFAAAPGKALAGSNGSSPDQIEAFFLRELRGQGFERFDVTYTWLRRLRIVAVSPKYTREIIVNPRTGEILRDYWITVGDADGSPDIFDPDISRTPGGDEGVSGGNSGPGANNNDDDNDDSDDNDDNDDSDDDDD